MRYFVTFFWAFILGQVVSYIGGALHHGSPYNFVLSTAVSLIIGVVVILIGSIAVPKKDDSISHS